MKFKTLLAGGLVAIATALPYAAQSALDPDINDKIRKEEAANSQVMRTLHYLADVYGPRVTGSPNHKAAAEWAVKTMTGWGMQNGHLEPWDWNHPGWANEHLAVHAVSPFKDALVVEALAWTPGTKGTVKAKAFNLVVPDGPLADPTADPSAAGRGGRGPARLNPTEAELSAFLNSPAIKEQIKGAAVLVGKPIFVPVNLTPPAGRQTDEQVRCRYDEAAANDPACANANQGRGGRGGGGGGGGRGQQPADPSRLTARQIADKIDAFLVLNQAAFRINDAGRAHGQIVAFDNTTYDITKAVPTVVMRNEDYGRIARILADGTPVELEATIVNKTYPSGPSYNTVAEIAGTDKAAEVVMAGGHLDSWQSATGATDNAIGCAIMMEAARILKAIGVQPRRTIRIALWSGEEEGLLGSLAYVKQHFGTAEAPKPEFATFNGYLNIDTGTGRLRGASVFGPPEGAKRLASMLAPFKDLKIGGATASSSRATGGTDSTSFNNAGLPGIGFSQDGIEYGSHTHHTNLDTYERVIEQDVRDAAVVVAGTLYQLAMQEQALPRFASDKMPPPPPQRGGGGQ
ncbi:MAG TPA: M20/M25/M40 family metallo-hydrolase [Vicinamibacterales bacterium]|nr:M20/M25/M40 family metallo-hydrolase [Vicinamibacterales bacterium]